MPPIWVAEIGAQADKFRLPDMASIRAMGLNNYIGRNCSDARSFQGAPKETKKGPRGFQKASNNMYKELKRF